MGRAREESVAEVEAVEGEEGSGSKAPSRASICTCIRHLMSSMGVLSRQPDGHRSTLHPQDEARGRTCACACERLLAQRELPLLAFRLLG